MSEPETQEPVQGKWHRNGFLVKTGPIKWYHYRWTDQAGWHKKRCRIVPKTASTKHIDHKAPHFSDEKKNARRVTIQFENGTETFRVRRQAIALGYWLEQEEDPTVYVYCPVRNNPEQYEWRCRIVLDTLKDLVTVRFEDGSTDRVARARLQKASERQLAAPSPPPISETVEKAKSERPEFTFGESKCRLVRRGRGKDKGYMLVQFENGKEDWVRNGHLKRVGPPPKRRRSSDAKRPTLRQPRKTVP